MKYIPSELALLDLETEAMRVLRFDYPASFERTVEVGASSLALAKEHLRRLALWLGPAGVQASHVLFMDITPILLPDLDLDDCRVGDIEAKFTGLYPRSLFRAYLRWVAVRTLPVVRARNLPDPFEPAVRIYERGGELFRHHGFIHVSHSIYFYPKALSNYATVPALVSVRDDLLDSIDRDHGSGQ